MEIYLVMGLLCVTIVLLIVLIIKTSSAKNESDSENIKNELASVKNDISNMKNEVSGSVRDNVSSLGNMIAQNQKMFIDTQSQNLSELDRHLNEKQQLSNATVIQSLNQLEERFKTFALENEQKLDNIRLSVERKLTYIQQDNNTKLDEMRKTVDEKLAATLEDKMTKSFKLVSERLEQVYKGLGEMQTLASGVGDLKKVLSNVKTRGILGEIQLGAILKEILSPEQYDENVAIKKNSRDVVEFAIKLPAQDDGFIYLPIDSKFPGDTYANLNEAYQSGNKEEIERASKQLISTIKSEAKDISSKYISPPETTDFAIMFLPFEGLYAQAINLGLVEVLQREYKVNIAGPSTMAALLNSLQMGFKTLAVQKRSAQVWDVLGAVKTEFNKFAGVLTLTQQKLEQANKELDSLIGVRTRQIQRKLNSVTALDDDSSKKLLDDGNEY